MFLRLLKKVWVLQDPKQNIRVGQIHPSLAISGTQKGCFLNHQCSFYVTNVWKQLIRTICPKMAMLLWKLAHHFLFSSLLINVNAPLLVQNKWAKDNDVKGELVMSFIGKKTLKPTQTRVTLINTPKPEKRTCKKARQAQMAFTSPRVYKSLLWECRTQTLILTL